MRRIYCLAVSLIFNLNAMQAAEQKADEKIEHKKKSVKKYQFFKKADQAFQAGQYRKALERYNKKFLALEAALAQAKVNIAEALIGVGQLQEGFPAFDRRLDIPDIRDGNRMRRTLLQKPYTGENPAGKTILFRREYGFGDTMMFIRYVQEFKKLGANIIVAAHPAEIPILQECAFIDNIVNEKEFDSYPAFDYDLFLMSSPCYISRAGLQPTKSPSDIPFSQLADGPYLRANSKVVEWWKEYLNDEKHGLKALHNSNLLVGVCWKASKLPAGQTPTRKLRRDIPIAILEPLSAIKHADKGITLISLQGPGNFPISGKEFKTMKADSTQYENIDEGDILPEGMQCINFAPFDVKAGKRDYIPGTHILFDRDHGSFADTAALMQVIKEQDGMVISVDTVIPHISAGMHVNTHLIFNKDKDVDMRWGTRQQPLVKYWYPTATAHRSEDLSTLQAAVTDALVKKAQAAQERKIEK